MQAEAGPSAGAALAGGWMRRNFYEKGEQKERNAFRATVHGGRGGKSEAVQTVDVN